MDNLKITTYEDAARSKRNYVFISYKKEDRDVVFNEYVIPLQKRYGLRVYCDKKFGDKSNEDWTSQMEDNLDAASACLVFASNKYLTSYACLLEVLVAVSNDIPIVKVCVQDGILEQAGEPGKRKISNSTKEKFTDVRECLKGEDDSKKNVAYKCCINLKSHISQGMVDKIKLSNKFLELYGNLGGTEIKRKDGIEENLKHIYTTLRNLEEEWGYNLFDEVESRDEGTISETEKTFAVEEKQVTIAEDKKLDDVQPDENDRRIDLKLDAANLEKVESVNYGKIYELNPGRAEFSVRFQKTDRGFRVLKNSRIHIGTNSPKGIIRDNESNLCRPVKDNRTLKNDIEFEGTESTLSCFISGGANYSKDIKKMLGNEEIINDKVTDAGNAKNKAVIKENDDKRAATSEWQPIQAGKGTNFGGNEIRYKLFGAQYQENQSDMMIKIFREVLVRHPEVLPDIIYRNGMTCLSGTDFTKSENRNGNMKSYFRQCAFFDINGGVCVGTAYGLDAKLNLIAKLLSYCGEELSVLKFEEGKYNDILVHNYIKGLAITGAGNKKQTSITEPKIDSNPNPYKKDREGFVDGASKKAETKGFLNANVDKEEFKKEALENDKSVNFSGNLVTYSLYGVEYQENQSDMMIRVFGEVMKRHQDKVPDLIKEMACLDRTDYTKKENRGKNMSSTFKNAHYFDFAGGFSVGTNYGKIEKVKKILKLLKYCGEPREVLRSKDPEIESLLDEGYFGKDRGTKESNQVVQEKMNVVEENHNAPCDKESTIVFLENKGISLTGRTVYAEVGAEDDRFSLMLDIKWLSKDMVVLLNNSVEKSIIVLRIPAHSFILGNNNGKQKNALKPRELQQAFFADVKIRKSDLVDVNSGCSFARYKDGTFSYG